ncbi:MAG: hypothetical protein HYZ14_05495 [Bacteroidetes bacterium]|nr:hypothetical protein [Bacteroidota bacterium]
MRFFLIFLGAAAGLFAFFYFYPAAMFQATISSNMAQVTADISLKTLLYKENFPNGILAENVTAVSLTVQGVLILIICLVALPLMIAYRFTKTKS